MDTDPLADTAHPRYQYESDDEEDEYNPSAPAPPARESLRVEFVGAPTLGHPLLIASGDAGRYWAAGAHLGEQTGVVAVEGTQVGLLFSPAWAGGQFAVLVSEATAQLPISAMHAYAKAILAQLKPSRVAVLDSYSVHSYVDAEPLPLHQAPVRHLCLRTTIDESFSCEPFTPPNLVQTTAASVLSILSLPSAAQTPATLLLLPSSHIPPARPQAIISKAPQAVSGEQHWLDDMMHRVHAALVSAMGAPAGKVQWEIPAAIMAKSAGASGYMKRQVQDSSMYM